MTNNGKNVRCCTGYICDDCTKEWASRSKSCPYCRRKWIWLTPYLSDNTTINRIHDHLNQNFLMPIKKVIRVVEVVRRNKLRLSSSDSNIIGKKKSIKYHDF